MKKKTANDLPSHVAKELLEELREIKEYLHLGDTNSVFFILGKLGQQISNRINEEDEAKPS